MNNNCHRKDCKYLKICTAMYDLADCSMYGKGKIPDSLVGVGPVDRQKHLIPPFGFGNEEMYQKMMESQYKKRNKRTI